MSGRQSTNASTLWMGDIDEDMNESFVRTSFNLMNYNPLHVKIVRNKFPGQFVGYGFITFENEETAQRALREVNGKQIPNSIQGKRFRLNHTSAKEEEFSIYVGDLGQQVNDAQLMAGFARRYPSVISAKVMTIDGQSRRFGFVRFAHESDYRRALTECDNCNMFGQQPITVRAAKPRRQRFNNSYKSRTFESNQEVMVPQVVPQTEIPDSVYGLEVSPYYGGVVSGQPVLVYPMMPFSAFPVNYESPYVYGQPLPYGQQVLYQTCDNMYSLVPNQMMMDQVGHSQLLDAKQMDKLNDEMISKEEFYSSIDSAGRWPTPIDAIDAEKESKMQ